jgi:hypothetical protein
MGCRSAIPLRQTPIRSALKVKPFMSGTPFKLPGQTKTETAYANLDPHQS